MIENEPTEKKSGVSAIVIGIVVLLCCICVLVGGMGWIWVLCIHSDCRQQRIFLLLPRPPLKKTPHRQVKSKLHARQLIQFPVKRWKHWRLRLSRPNEPKELACRMEGKCDVPDVIATSAEPRVSRRLRKILGDKCGHKRKYGSSSHPALCHTSCLFLGAGWRLI